MRNSNARQPNEALASETRSFRMPKLRFSREVFRLGNPGNTNHAQTGLTISSASAAAIRRLSARRRRNTSTRSVWAEGCERYDRRTDCDHTIRRARADDQRSLGSGGRNGGPVTHGSYGLSRSSARRHGPFGPLPSGDDGDGFDLDEPLR